MKKVMLSLLGSCFAVTAFANQGLCGYKDYFHLSDTTHPGIYIVAANSNPDIIIQVIGPRSFELRDTENCRAGYAHVTVGYDVNNWCILDLQDGPFMWSPIVHASCNGLIYRGISYDGINSYSYSLNFA